MRNPWIASVLKHFGAQVPQKIFRTKVADSKERQAARMQTAAAKRLRKGVKATRDQARALAGQYDGWCGREANS